MPFPDDTRPEVSDSQTQAVKEIQQLLYEHLGQTADQQTFRIVSSPATTNASSVKGSPGVIQKVTGFNANAAARYLKLYDKATAPTVGTDTPIWTEYLPAQSEFDLDFVNTSLRFRTGIALALTTGAADADTGALTIADILALNVAYL